MQSSVTSPSQSSSTIKSFKQRKWFVDLSKRPEKYALATQEFANPFGYSDRVFADTTSQEEGQFLASFLAGQKLFRRKILSYTFKFKGERLSGMRSWDIALGPIKQAPMNIMISWMAGNSIALFPIMFVGMLLFRPFQSMLQMSKAFETIEPSQYSGVQKLIYFLGNLVNLGIALYKCHSMGLLPTYASDWLAFESPQIQMEQAFGGYSFN